MVVKEAPTRAGPRNGEADLRVDRVSKRFAGVQALREVSCRVGRNEIAGLIGPNGAGKTTLFNCLTGFMPIDAGEIWHRSTRLDGSRPEKIAALGLIRTFQNIRMFRDLTPFESLLVAQHVRYASQPIQAVLGLRRFRRTMSTVYDRADEILELVTLNDARRKKCKELTLLQQRKLELGRALAAGPTVLLLDEVSAGATAGEARELVEVILGIRESGTTILVIEHNVAFVMALADRLTVLNFGEVIAEGPPEAIRENALVKEIYLGT